jgi:hypothetical protein
MHSVGCTSVTDGNPSSTKHRVVDSEHYETIGGTRLRNAVRGSPIILSSPRSSLRIGLSTLTNRYCGTLKLPTYFGDTLQLDCLLDGQQLRLSLGPQFTELYGRPKPCIWDYLPQLPDQQYGSVCSQLPSATRGRAPHPDIRILKCRSNHLQ